jgi:hypothetical protein
VTAGGWSASPDAVHSAPDFPAYWDSHFRQFIYYDGHNGYDYNLWYQPVYAAAAGKVIFAGWEYPGMPDHGYGKMVMIDHHNGYVTLYGHFSRLLVHKGQRVARNQEIGVSGDTGHSSGPHLHFTVFHNCTPTDPYGWAGSGSDPLEGYQGESSVFLWKRQPLLDNPAPGWPGSASLPSTTVTRLALLRLPAAGKGTKSFTRALSREARATVKALRRAGISAHQDLLRGVVVVTGRASASQLYRAPHVVSLTTPDVEEGDRSDVLAALARAALADRRTPFHVARSSKWTGRVLRWQGRAFLVGKGERGKKVDLRLDAGGSRQAHSITADPGSGAYAVDLGRMSSRQMQALIRDLQGRGTGGSSVTLKTVRSAHPQPAHASAGRAPWIGLIGALLLLLGGGAAALWKSPLVRRETDAGQ